ncbi:hypothetical protein [Legionella brunensis]|uniref:Uncharacterized protein n=2 Tax=Legionella brunensis TaxID=29422 RepID=A0A0W0SDX5_9GAMM|nr:hypothetical protein [Legionella brunensis]KTC81676.1 hypothetical protein Lbru_2196 [Legionella brunensis]
MSTCYKNLMVKGLVTLLFLGCCTAFAANKQTNIAAHSTNFMFLQNAETGVLKLTPQEGSYQLVLQNVQPYVTYFSDRPKRMTGLMSIESFLKEWQSNTKNGFKNDAPNVGIEGIKLHAFSNGQTVSVVMVLSNPIYDKNANTLTYMAHELNTKEGEIKKDIKLNNLVLFIDNIDSCPSCCCGFSIN